MGYRSDIVIGVNKTVLARNLITSEIPKCLFNETQREDKDTVYWILEGWKWYSDYSEVRQIEAWFDSMEEDEFGAIRVGEDTDDTQHWGCPHDFEIYVHHYVQCPI